MRSNGEIGQSECQNEKRRVEGSNVHFAYILGSPAGHVDGYCGAGTMCTPNRIPRGRLSFWLPPDTFAPTMCQCRPMCLPYVALRLSCLGPATPQSQSEENEIESATEWREGGGENEQKPSKIECHWTHRFCIQFTEHIEGHLRDGMMLV